MHKNTTLSTLIIRRKGRDGMSKLVCVDGASGFVYRRFKLVDACVRPGGDRNESGIEAEQSCYYRLDKALECILEPFKQIPR